MHSESNYFHRKKLDDPAQLDKNTGRYCDKKFHGLYSQEIRPIFPEMSHL